MEPLFFDSPAETDVVKRFPLYEKVFVFASDGTRTRDSPTKAPSMVYKEMSDRKGSGFSCLGGEVTLIPVILVSEMLLPGLS